MEEKTLTPEEKEEVIESTEEPCPPEEGKIESGAEAEAEVEEEEETEEAEVEEGAEEEVETAEEAEVEEAEVETPTVAVAFSWRPPVPEKVFIAGTFNDWNPSSHQLTRTETGEWQITLDLTQGTYEYQLIVDGKWITDPTCEDKVENSHGGYNSVLTVK
ncbi:hypothetical protein H8E77_32340 [bacterium]|nr:hypothetical protein [bacterium]